MTDAASPKFSLTFYASLDAHGGNETVHGLTLAGLAARLGSHTLTERKESVQMFGPHVLKEETPCRGENVTQVTMAVFDFDKVDTTKFIPIVQRMVDRKIAFLIYTTWSHRNSNVAYSARIAVPLHEPVPADEWSHVWPALNAELAGGLADAKCKDRSRRYFFPAAHPHSPADERVITWADGWAFVVTATRSSWDATAKVRPPGAKAGPSGDLAGKALRAAVDQVRNAVKGRRHDTVLKSAFKLGGFVARNQLPADDVIEALLAAAVANGFVGPGEDQDSEAKVRSTIADGLKGGAARLVDELENRAPINLLPGQRAQVIEELLNAVGGADPPLLFEHAGRLVQVVSDTSDGARFHGVTASTFPEIASRVAVLLRMTRTGIEPVDCPPSLSKGFVERGTWPQIMELRGLARGVLVRRDGTIAGSDGYDAESRYWLTERLELDLLPEPTAADASAALDVLHGAVEDFPFATPVDRSAWVAALLTLVARPSIDGPIPLVLVTSPTPGIGKTKLAAGLAMIAFGGPPETLTYVDDPAESRKQLTTLIQDGFSYVLIDNVPEALGNHAIDSAITNPGRWTDRQLGSNTLIRAEMRTMFAATGNNVRLRGTLRRRVLVCRLESKEERPELRSNFRHPSFEAHVRRARPALVAAALTILRAHAIAGFPSLACAWGSFEEFSLRVRSAILFAGDVDPWRTHVDMDSDDDDNESLTRDAISMLHRLDPTSLGVTAATIFSRRWERMWSEEQNVSMTIDQLLEGRNANPRELGKALSKIRGRVVDGQWIERRSAGKGRLAYFVAGARTESDPHVQDDAIPSERASAEVG